MIPVLFAAPVKDWPNYELPLRRAFENAGLEVDCSPDVKPEDARYLVYAPNSSFKDFGAFPQARAVLNLWAGVEDVVDNPTLRVPLARMVDPGLTEGMVEWVVGHVLRHHLDIDHCLRHQKGE